MKTKFYFCFACITFFSAFLNAQNTGYMSLKDIDLNINATSKAVAKNSMANTAQMSIQSTIDPVLADSLQAAFERAAEELGVIGLSVAVNFGEGDIWAAATGISSSTDSLTTDHVIGIGSVTKTFTSAAILSMVDEGLLKLDDTIGTWIPAHPKIDGSIKVYQLLNHTSGIFNYTEHYDFFPIIFATMDTMYEATQILNFVESPSFAPGEDWEYSNTNYLLLGLIIESISGKDYHTAVRERVLTPYGFDDIVLLPQESPNGTLAGVWWQEDEEEPAFNIWEVESPTGIFSSAWAAGAYLATPTDISEWARQLYSGALLGDATNLMYDYNVDIGDYTAYGLGVLTRQVEEEITLIGHDGNILYESQVFYLPEKDLSFAIHTNDATDFFNLDIVMQLLYNEIEESAQEEEFDGLWKSQGYGLFVEIQDGILDLYDYTSMGMFPQISIPIIGNTIPTAGTLRLADGFLIFEDCCDEKITFEATTEKPAILEESADPQLNFDFFWLNLQEWCALFPILDLDWQAEYDAASNQITASTTPQELFTIMSMALGKFNDGHSILLNPETEELYRGGSEITGLWGENATELRSIIEQKYIVEDEFKVFLDNQFSYGTLENNIGYIMINAFAFDEDSEQDDELYVSALDESISYLQNTDGLIIDIRGNNGGYDRYGRLLANRLTKEKLHVYSKQVRIQESYDAFSEPRKFFIEPEGLQYIDRPVVVLTSQASVSAADVFSMIVKEIDCVTSMGTNSYGVFSNVWTKELPNGWILGFSPERYLDKDGIDYEQKGIEPDIVVEESLALFNEGVDNVLEYAIENISESCDVMISVVESELPEFTLFPNPVSDYVMLNISDLKEPVLNVSLINTAGLQVANITNLLENGNRYFWDVSGLPPGIYTIIVQTGFETYGKKLMVQ